MFEDKKIFEDENGFIYLYEGDFKIYWKKKELKPDVDIKFSRLSEAWYYLRSVS